MTATGFCFASEAPSRHMKRAALLVVSTSLFVLPAASDEPGVDARLVCPREAAPGRVRCELELEAPRGRLEWGDALVVAAPPNAPPLRARIGPRMATDQTERRLRLPVSLVATRAGGGRLLVLGRAVVCLGEGGGCVAAMRQAEATVEVGPTSREPR